MVSRPSVGPTHYSNPSRYQTKRHYRRGRGWAAQLLAMFWFLTGSQGNIFWTCNSYTRRSKTSPTIQIYLLFRNLCIALIYWLWHWSRWQLQTKPYEYTYNWLLKYFASRNFCLNILVKPLLYCNKGEFVAAPCVLVWNWFCAQGEETWGGLQLRLQIK